MVLFLIHTKKRTTLIFRVGTSRTQRQYGTMYSKVKADCCCAVLLFVPLVKSGGRQSQGENYDDDAAKTLLNPNFFASNQREQDGYTEA